MHMRAHMLVIAMAMAVAHGFRGGVKIALPGGRRRLSLVMIVLRQKQQAHQAHCRGYQDFLHVLSGLSSKRQRVANPDQRQKLPLVVERLPCAKRTSRAPQGYYPPEGTTDATIFTTYSANFAYRIPAFAGGCHCPGPEQTGSGPGPAEAQPHRHATPAHGYTGAETQPYRRAEAAISTDRPGPEETGNGNTAGQLAHR